MQRGSDKHAPRLDDELKDETQSLERGAPVEARADEAREEEGPAEGEPTPTTHLQGDRGLTPDEAPEHDDLVDRHEVGRHLQGSVFPGDRDALIASAREMNAPAAVVELLSRLPANERYETLQDVWEALGREGDRRPHM